MNPKIKKTLLLILKVGISLTLFYLVFKKIDVDSVVNIVLNTQLGYLCVAILFFIISQIISSYRLNYLFHSQDFQLSQLSNLKLYLLGMFYNFFVPGGVGGDAFKVYLLNKNFKWKSKNILKLVFIDRLIGLAAIACIVYLIIAIYPAIIGSLIHNFADYNLWFVLLFPVIIASGQQITSKLFKVPLKQFYYTLLYSVIIQGMQIISVVFITLALGISTEMYYLYIFVFLLSSVFSVISFAGIGIREFLFFEMSIHFSLDQNTAVTIGTLFTLITAFISIFGIYYHFKKPSLSLQDINGS
ncbi:hypothetical protein NBRC110019_30920 [Neptunitalea chrysea]|uniref:Flippase-like domain-containing protein n=1 Tax=Neptunitalea chrysea TaxID=1647581 RepID=A0A9W6EWA9_9FLAO|nr:lysylphosphatidylglycerol synthase transmembrane domain-containing protein [Neptunitalea chrysea]GLB54051.1 hypothetical protein NBRC110019_30920 [Neptunitalea chrysea]